MPLDDAIGDLTSCAAPGRDVPRFSRPSTRAKSETFDTPSQLPVSASLVIASVTGVDVLVLSGSAIAAAMICAEGGVACAAGKWFITALVTVAVSLDMQRRLSAYTVDGIRNLRGRLSCMLMANLLGGAAGTLCLTLISAPALAVRLWLPAWLGASILAGSLAAIVSARKVGRLCASGRLAHHVAVVGTGPYARDFVQDLRDQPGDMIQYAGTFDDGDTETGVLPVMGLRSQASCPRIDSVVLCVPIGQTERIARLRAQLRELNCDNYIAGDFLDPTWASETLDRLGQQRVVKLESRPLDDWQSMQKAVFDRLAAMALIVALAPVLLLIALVVSLDSAGPVLFRQPRLGLNNRVFTMFKFRTMYHHHADLHGGRQATRDDPRVTRLGRLLRRTSLDELPQLFNVLAGDMSLVGPRPHAAATRAGGLLFHDVVADYRLRHRVKPGITGWAQVNGWRGETTTFHQIEQRVAHDLYYIDHWSLLFDVRIVFLTLFRVWNSKAAF
jgi:Undecaprenyl-phosphate glucose phosphotransferase